MTKPAVRKSPARPRMTKDATRAASIMLALLETEGRLFFLAYDNREVADLLVSYGGTTKKLVYPADKKVIEQVDLTLGDLSFSMTFHSRPALPDELEQERHAEEQTRARVAALSQRQGGAS